jgi:hypothetical protein
MADLPVGYVVDQQHDGLVTYDRLVNEGSVQTAAYMKSVDGLRIYRSAFDRTMETAGPSIIWTWVLVYKDQATAHGFFAEHAILYPDFRLPPSPFPNFAQESETDYATTTSASNKYDLYHALMRQQNVVAYVAILYVSGMGSDSDVQHYVKILETRLLKVTINQ